MMQVKFVYEGHRVSVKVTGSNNQVIQA